MQLITLSWQCLRNRKLCPQNTSPSCCSAPAPRGPKSSELAGRALRGTRSCGAVRVFHYFEHLQKVLLVGALLLHAQAEKTNCTQDQNVFSAVYYDPLSETDFKPKDDKFKSIAANIVLCHVQNKLTASNTFNCIIASTCTESELPSSFSRSYNIESTT